MGLMLFPTGHCLWLDPLSGRASVRVSDPHFLIDLFLFYLFNIILIWAKIVRGDVKEEELSRNNVSLDDL